MGLTPITPYAQTVLGGSQEGPRTPSVTFGNGQAGQAYSAQTGWFTRIGNLVFLRFRIAFTNKGTSTGGASLEGLPYPIGEQYGALTFGYYAGMNLPDAGMAGFPSSGTNVTLRSFTTGQAVGVSDAHFTNSSTLIGGLDYLAAP